MIAEVGPGARRRPARVLDAEGCVVAPGLVDIQVHFREPGDEEAETIETGARAAALGGFTAVVAHAEHRRRRSTTPRSSDRCSSCGRRAAACDVVSSGCITKGRAGRRARAARRALRPRRAGLHRRRRLRRRRQRHAPRASSTRRSLPGAVIAQHAEDPTLVGRRVTCTKASGRPRSASPGAPAEAESIDRRPRPRSSPSSPAAAYHVLHLSTAASADLVRAAKARGRAGHRRGDAPALHAHRRRVARRSTRCSR